ncbi:MAG: hypothetical protein M3083_20365 [Actinomycetota bacterium]|nr:hypothetical protein [Actinomycetota bacterium]
MVFDGGGVDHQEERVGVERSSAVNDYGSENSIFPPPPGTHDNDACCEELADETDLNEAVSGR